MNHRCIFHTCFAVINAVKESFTPLKTCLFSCIISGHSKEKILRLEAAPVQKSARAALFRTAYCKQGNTQ